MAVVQRTEGIGASIKRREDPRFITGKGYYTDDVKLPGMLHMAVLRSPYGHAKITKIDVSRARNHPGVQAVFTGQDTAGKLNPMPCVWLVPDADLKVPVYNVMATDRVRYTGEAVAAVVADDSATARDALDLIEVEYESLPVVTDEVAAMAEGAPQLHDEIAGNVMFHWNLPGIDHAAVDAAFRDAEVVIKQRLVQQRLVPNAMETRSTVAQWSPGTDEMTVWNTSQNPHIARFVFSVVTGIPENKIRVIARDVGGGFGSKIDMYPTDMLTMFAARETGRPVKWTEDRRENFVATIHGRAQTHDAELAATKDGKVTALRVTSYANMGAYITTGPGAGVPTYLFALVLPGCYTIPHVACDVYGIATNTTPTSAYRGAGRPEASYLIERMMDLLADELKIDPVELRRKNFIAADAFPYTSATGLSYDSGNYQGALDKALEIVDYQSLLREQEQLRQQGRYMGIGFSTYMECCGLAPSRLMGVIGFQAGQWDVGTVRVLVSGKAVVLTGTSPHGQGEETTYAQIVSDKLGIPVDDIEVVHGDTGAIPMGWGTYGSRGHAVGASAVHVATLKVLEKAKKLAAHILEAAPEDIVAESGTFYVQGSPSKSVSIQQLAGAANLGWSLPEGMLPGLEESSVFDPANFVFPFGTHICVVDVEPETGEVTIRRYLAVDDCGIQVNPMIVQGQVHGGVAQGIGQALYEHAIYDENGQLVTGSMLDYTVPNATQIPDIETAHTVTPAPQVPTGGKGIGEAGTIASSQAVVNAVVDALSPLGIKHIDMPLTPERVWRAMQAAQANRQPAGAGQ